MLFVISDFTSVSIVYKLVTIPIHYITEVLFRFLFWQVTYVNVEYPTLWSTGQSINDKCILNHPKLIE